MEKIKGITIKLGADTTDLNDALKEIDKQTSKTTKNLKDIEKLLKLDPTNTELLRQKQVELGNVIKSTSTKLEALNQAQNQLRASGVSETSSEYMALSREIIKTQNSLDKFNAEALETKQALNGVVNGSKKATAEEKKEATQIKKTGKEHKSANKDINATAVNLASIISVAKTAVDIAKRVASKLIEISTATASYAGTLNDLKDITGLSLSELQELSYISEMTGVSLETIASSIRKNTKSMQEARSYSFAYMEAYEMLGVSIYDTNGELRNSGDVFLDVIDALQKMEEGTERDIIATTLLGKSATELNPLINEGSAALRQYVKEAEQMGYILDEELVNDFDQLDKDFTRFKLNITTVRNSIASQLLPTMESLTKGMIETLTSVSKSIQENDFTGALDKIVTKATDLLGSSVASIIDNLPEATKLLLEAVKGIITGTIDKIPEWASQLPTLLGDLIVTGIQGIDIVTEVLKAVGNLGVEMIQKMEDPQFLQAIFNSSYNIGAEIVNGINRGLEQLDFIQIIAYIEEAIRKLPIKIGSLFAISLAGLGKGVTDSIIKSSDFSTFKAKDVPYITIPKIENEAVITNPSGTTNTTNNYTTNTTNNYSSKETPEIKINFTGDLSQLAELLEPEVSQVSGRKGQTMADLR